MMYPELDDPPDAAQLSSWAKTRSSGCFGYVLRRILVLSSLWIVMWLASGAIYRWLSGKDFDFTRNIGFVLPGPVIGWMIFRGRWVKNEQIYAAAQVERQE